MVSCCAKIDVEFVMSFRFCVVILITLIFDRFESQYVEEGNNKYIHCNESYKMGILRDYGPKRLDKVRLVKFPRTGVTFCTTVLRYACEELDSSRALDHISMVKNYAWKKDKTCLKHLLIPHPSGLYNAYPLRYEDSGHAVAMFRNPGEFSTPRNAFSYTIATVPLL